MHISLHGFVAGPGGEMNQIKVDEKKFTEPRSVHRNAILIPGAFV